MSDNMALSVDRFVYLEREILSLCSAGRDWLALAGAFWLTRRTLSLLGNVLAALKTYGVSSIAGSPDLVKKYGKWAGKSLLNLSDLALDLENEIL